MKCRQVLWMLIVLLGALAHRASAQTVKDVYDYLQQGKPTGAASKALEQFLQKKFEKQDLTKGTHKHLVQNLEEGGGYVAWVLQAPGNAKPVVVAEKGQKWPMVRIGTSNLWVAAEKFPNFSAAHYRYEVNGQRLGGSERVGFESYTWLPDSLEQPGVPKGQLIEMGKHVSKTYFPGAQRDWWVYVPAQYDSQKPAKLLVFNDGGGFAKGEGNACTVLDNLIHQKKVPVTIAVFINPGVFPEKNNQSNRGNEYDTCTPRFATFLDEEMLPLVREKYRISDDPWDHAICGSSSGGSCAFTAAWHRNDLFRRVITFVGSFCDFRPLQDYPVYGGDTFSLERDRFGQWKTAHDYPALIRKTNPKKEIKIFLQDGENDLDNTLGNWPLNNERMAAALEYGGYDYKFVMGKGIHSSRHGKAILPEILVWLWEDAKQ